MIQKQLHHKENTTSLYPKKGTQDKSRTIKAKYCNFQTNLNKTASAQNMEKLHKNANLTNFRKLNRPYTMRMALMKTIAEKQHHPKKISSAKRTCQIKTAKLVPVPPLDGAQYANVSADRRSGKRSKKKQQ